MALYDTTAKQWKLYPTSLVSYVPWTLPYFDVSNGSVVWFNEHYGNRLGEICCNRSSLTEYSFSNPPVENISQIDNTLTIALGQNRVWFTEWTANYVGFVDSTYQPTFSVSLSGNATLRLQPGSTTRMELELRGESSKNLSLQFSDSEQVNGTPKEISIAASPPTVASLSGEQLVTVMITASKNAPPGQYNALITVTDGLVYRSVYLTIVITG
jgi:uncharacterized membrane protein